MERGLFCEITLRDASKSYASIFQEFMGLQSKLAGFSPFNLKQKGKCERYLGWAQFASPALENMQIPEIPQMVWPLHVAMSTHM